MQLMATRGKEHVTTDGFQLDRGRRREDLAARGEPEDSSHGLEHARHGPEHPVLERLPLGPQGRHAYFVHSYHLNATNEAEVLGARDYGGPVTAMVGRDTAIAPSFTLRRASVSGWLDFELSEVEAVISFPPST